MASVTRSLRPLSAFVSRRVYRSAFSHPTTRRFCITSSAHAKKYTKDHEWVELSPDSKTGYIGISTYAAHALGDVVYVELPTTPMEVAAGDTIGAVESVKSASDINSPVSCTIVEANTLLEEKPGTINKGPEESGSAGGWVAKIEVSEDVQEELENLMDEGAYKAFTDE